MQARIKTTQVDIRQATITQLRTTATITLIGSDPSLLVGVVSNSNLSTVSTSSDAITGVSIGGEDHYDHVAQRGYSTTHTNKGNT